MNYPRRASVKLLAPLTLACLAAAFPLQHAAQNASSKKQPSSNGKIVYQSDQAGDPGINDVYTMDADGKHETRLTTNAADDAAPVWSPQGDKIAFVSNRRGDGYEIYLMNADGSNQRPLRADAPVRAIAADWSPDGSRLAYAEGDDVYVIQVVAPGGGDSTSAPVNVSADKAAGSQDMEPAWSPGGSKLVVRNATDCGGCSDLYTVNADGSGRAQLTTAPGFEAGARWSPSGDFIAYEADRLGRGLYVIDAQGVGPEVKVSGGVGSLGGGRWSPDGSRLAFTSLSGPVHVVKSDGTALTVLTEMAGTSSSPFWSPDGQKVAFQNGGDLHVVTADGAGRRAANYTKTRRADEFASSWQCVTTP